MKLEEFRKKADALKKALIAKAKRKGIYENFGQKEGRELSDLYYAHFYNPYSAEAHKILDDFYDWCESYNGEK